MDWKDSRVLVTGATGFVGSWVIKRLLAEGAYVVAFVRDWDPQSEVIRSGDINCTKVVNGVLEDYAAVGRAINEHDIDTVVHLGAQSLVVSAVRSPLQTFESNIRGTYNVLEACRTHKASIRRVVVASSDKAYGEAKALPYREEMSLNGCHPYDVSKSCADLIAMTYAETYDLPVAVARCGNVYGGGDLNWSRIVPGTIRSVLRDEAPVIRSDGRYVRDYIFVADVVEAYLVLAWKVPDAEVRGKAFNFSCERPIRALELVEKIQEMMGREALRPAILDQARGEIKEQYLDATRARRILGWTPRYGFEAGLASTIEWYEQFFKALK